MRTCDQLDAQALDVPQADLQLRSPTAGHVDLAPPERVATFPAKQGLDGNAAVIDDEGRPSPTLLRVYAATCPGPGGRLPAPLHYATLENGNDQHDDKHGKEGRAHPDDDLLEHQSTPLSLQRRCTLTDN